MVRVMHRDLLRGVQALVSTALPSLRVVALTYTGLGGVAALVLVIAVAVMPKQPLLEQVTEPARQAVTNFVPPAVEFIARPSAQVAPPPAIAPTAAPFMATVTIDVTIEDAEPLVLEEPVVVEPEPTVAPVPVARPVFIPTLVVTAPAPEEQAVDEEQPEDDVVDELAPVEITPAATAKKIGRAHV